jgi:hypothetical protein
MLGVPTLTSAKKRKQEAPDRIWLIGGLRFNNYRFFLNSFRSSFAKVNY